MARPLKKIQGLYEKIPGSGIWYIRYRIKGRLVRKMIGPRDAAIAALDKVTTIRTSGLGVLGTSAKAVTLTHAEQATAEIGKITVGEICDHYLAHILNPHNTERPRDLINPPQRIRAIRAQFGERAAEALIGSQIRAWLTTVSTNASTRNRYKSTFSSIYRLAKEEGKVGINPVRDTPQFAVLLSDPVWLKPQDEVKLRAVLSSWVEDCPDHHVLTKLYLRCHEHELTIALGTGMRKGNQYALRWEDVDFDRRVIFLPKTKNGRSHTVPMIDDVYATLKSMLSIQDEIARFQQLSKRRESSTSVRMVASGRVFNTTENREWWAKAIKEAGLKVRWHDLRHTFASRMVGAGVPLKTVQDACGHQSVQTTNRYAHLDQAHLHAAMSVLNRGAAAI